MMEKFLFWMLDHGFYFLAFPIAIALVRYKFMEKELRYIIALLVLSALAEAVSIVLTKYFGYRNNLFILHLDTLLEFNIIALFYYSFFGYFYHRSLVPNLMVFFSCFAFINTLFFQKLTEFNTYARGLESILVIVLSLLCFYKMLTELATKRPEKKPIFWINTGFLFYFAGSFLLFILSNVVLKENKSFNLLSWGLHSLLYTFLHIFIGIGLWYSPHPE